MLYSSLDVLMKDSYVIAILLHFNGKRAIIKTGGGTSLKSVRAFQLSLKHLVYFGLYVVTQEEQGLS